MLISNRALYNAIFEKIMLDTLFVSRVLYYANFGGGPYFFVKFV